MDDFWFWASLAWDVGVAWFSAWPVLLQIAAVLIALYAMFCLVIVAVSATARVVRWVRGLRGKRLTLPEKQEGMDAIADDEWDVAAIIASVEAQLRAEREKSK